MFNTQSFEGATHVARYNGHAIYFTEFSFDDACKALIERVGGNGVGLKVEAVEESPRGDAAPKSDPAPSSAPVQVGQINADGKARVERDAALAESLGFALKAPIYDTGSQATGLDKRRAEFEELDSAKAEAAGLSEVVRAEERQTLNVEAASIRMTGAGSVVLGREKTDRRIKIAERAFPRLCSRLGMPSGAGSYLGSVWPELRAVNVNQWGLHLDREQVKAREEHASKQEKVAYPKRKAFEPDVVALRTRKGVLGNREIFAAVSDSYPEFDVNLIADAIHAAVPSDARASAVYDGYRMRFDALWFTDVPGDQGVAGEIFKAGVRVRTDDTGGGSVRVDAIVWRNLCLNFIIIGTSKQSIASIRHLGSVADLASKFRKAFGAALGTVEAFRSQWGYAVAEDVLPAAVELARKQDVDGVPDEGLVPVSVALPWLFNGMLDSKEFATLLPRRDRGQTVDDLVRMWNKEPAGQITRAGVVNSVTRYAHEVNDNPFAAHDIERAAGQLLYGRAPLPLLPLEA